MKRDLIRVSKFLSLVLRHQPQKIGLSLDEFGWAKISELIACAKRSGTQLSEELIAEVVRDNDKQRFKLSEDKTKIRANQGHSVQVNLELKPVKPPEMLYHGTADRFVSSILKHGLRKGKRQYVHLSKDRQTATRVGTRHGTPVVLVIHSGKMYDQGLKFFLSENKVWLTAHVPPEYIKL
jgi:putative RNA 2'-phosphotransferase